jgi:heme/copper-type cytochrome/quinol oxidase subunit 3
LNFVETVGAFIVSVAVALLVWNILTTLRNGQRAGDNPWNAWTLEWATSSPPPGYNFLALPTIAGNRPLYELQHPAGRLAVSTRLEHSAEPAGVHAPGPVDFVERLHAPVLGILAFIFSEATFFACLIVAFTDFRFKTTGSPGPHDLDVPRTVLFSLFLFASSGSIYLAERALGRDNQTRFRVWWLATIALGTIFLIGQLTEYFRMYADGISIDRNTFTSAFFTLTGFHGFHVTVGLVALGIVAALGFRGDYRAGQRRVVVDTVSIYWHFVDAVWVFVLSIVYLWSLIA